MNSAARFLGPSEVAKQLGISTKALRLYEQRGLITPSRTSAGWRAYGAAELARATDIVELRALGLSLSEIARIFAGDTQTVDRTLAAHKKALEDRVHQLSHTLGKVSRLRSDLSRGKVPAARELIRVLKPTPEITVAFNLPWPWGGEPFELRDIRTLNYIVGPLGSGKTQLAMHLAAALPDAAFLGLDRLANEAAAARASLDADVALKSRVDKTLTAIVDDGGVESGALLALLTALETEDPPILVIDMLEQGLDAATQEALIVHLRRRGPTARPLFFLTRSSVILDLDCVGADEAIILCPANHSPPSWVIPCPGSPGYEAVATCLASPDVRARTEGMVAHIPVR
ncbi:MULTISPECIES: MerR family transcriptional regulator [unclassified Bradyrhizobium]|uniref:MerR family transcriptional regulator n=1 Tax=unclassified Bradyrhizobium TaxID=2631580 RepID=UPI002916F5A9|nr:MULTISPECIES: MerR family transcriptional regulator [unclassified Bradyrhizobium]